VKTEFAGHMDGDDYNRLLLFSFMLLKNRFDPVIDGKLVHQRFKGPVLTLAYAIAQEVCGDRLESLLPQAVGSKLDKKYNKVYANQIIEAAKHL
jgi:hypothetical protein